MPPSAPEVAPILLGIPLQLLAYHSARLLGRESIRVNSLHGQGILEPGARVAIEGIAEDGTIEAIRIAEATGFALGVQWHAEYDAESDPVNRALFSRLGDAARARCRDRRFAAS